MSKFNGFLQDLSGELNAQLHRFELIPTGGSDNILNFKHVKQWHEITGRQDNKVGKKQGTNQLRIYFKYCMFIKL